MWQTWRWKIQLLIIIAAVIFVLFVFAESVSARVFGEVAKDEKIDTGLELSAETFNSSLWAAPASWAVVEFYAHWCPLCQNFKPQYERVAQLFNGADAVYPGVVLMAKVDCAEQINKNLCQRFLVNGYPTLLWGKPAAFAWGSRLHDEANHIEKISSRYNAEALLDWINNRLGRSFILDATNDKKQLAQVTGEGSGQLFLDIHDIEEATAEAYNIILDNKLVSSKHRAPFVQFLQLLAVHHPSRSCRAGSAEILFNLMRTWPAEHVVEADELLTGRDSQKHTIFADVKALRQFHVCGRDLPSGNYKSCSTVKGGYSCGLWYLFHALSVRVDDVESRSAAKAIRNFVGNFFICEECREHFLKMTESSIGMVTSRRTLALWLWRSHNEVNVRLAKEAAELNLELPRPKVEWPPKQICTSCRITSEVKHDSHEEDVEWDEDRVYQFLRRTYWQSFQSVSDAAKTGGGTRQLVKADEVSYDEGSMTNSAFTVPVGAALGVAMASCGFGVAACCWRLHQKKSKHMRRRI